MESCKYSIHILSRKPFLVAMNVILRSDEVLYHLEAAQQTSVVELLGQLMALHDESFLSLVFV